MSSSHYYDKHKLPQPEVPILHHLLNLTLTNDNLAFLLFTVPRHCQILSVGKVQLRLYDFNVMGYPLKLGRLVRINTEKTGRKALALQFTRFDNMLTRYT